MADDPSLSRLIQQHVGGDESNRELLADRIQAIVFRIVATRLSAKAFIDDRDDLTQDTVVHLLGSLGKLKSYHEGAIVRWINTSTVRACLNFFKSKKRESRRLADRPFNDLVAELVLPSPAASRHQEMKLFIDWLDDELARFARLIMSGLNWKQIEGEMGVSRRQIDNLRIRLRLRYQRWRGNRDRDEEMNNE